MPQDRVLIEDRDSQAIRFSWATVTMAQTAHGNSTSSQAGVSTLEGRWQKIAMVLLWKLAKDGVILTQWDRDQVPHDKTLLAHGHAQDIEYRFVPRIEAQRMRSGKRRTKVKYPGDRELMLKELTVDQPEPTVTLRGSCGECRAFVPRSSRPIYLGSPDVSGASAQALLMPGKIAGELQLTALFPSLTAIQLVGNSSHSGVRRIEATDAHSRTDRAIASRSTRAYLHASGTRRRSAICA